MCQLTFVHSKKATSNRILLLNQWFINTRTLNHDGFGIFNGTKVFKDGQNAAIIYNFGTWFRDVIDASPLIGHVRLATAVAGKAKVIDSNSAHPFEGEKLVLAHNGMLEFKDPKNLENHKDTTVDSLIFLKELESRYDGTDLLKALQDTMELFTGTFAFLIYSKLERKYYVCRGWTKKLHQSTLTFTFTPKDAEPVVYSGLMINTDKEDLAQNLHQSQALIELNGTKVEYTVPVELKSETLYEVDLNASTLVEKGTVKENQKSFLPAVVTTTTPRTTTTSTGNIPDDTKVYYNPRVRSEVVKKFAEWMNLMYLSESEVDYICWLSFGKGICYCQENELEYLNKNIMPKLMNFYTDKKQKIWYDLLYSDFNDPMTAYKQYGIEFPYFLNSKQVLNKAYWKSRDVARNNKGNKK